MPWRVNPKNRKEVQKRAGGRWVHHAWAKTIEKAFGMVAILRRVGHGDK
jgi:hypothetical protein